MSTSSDSTTDSTLSTWSDSGRSSADVRVPSPRPLRHRTRSDILPCRRDTDSRRLCAPPCTDDAHGVAAVAVAAYAAFADADADACAFYSSGVASLASPEYY